MQSPILTQREAPSAQQSEATIEEGTSSCIQGWFQVAAPIRLGGAKRRARLPYFGVF